MLAFAGGCGHGDEERSKAAGANGPTAPRGSAISECRQADGPKFEPALYETPEQTMRKGEKLTAVVKTNCGTFEIALDTEDSPTAVNSFVFLARKGFYEGLGFDQAAAGTYLHGGDPPGEAIGPGYSVKGEVPGGIVYRYRAVAMAQPGEAPSGEAGSQFFIVLAKPFIDLAGKYPLLGKVAEGLEVVERINALGPPDNYPGDSNVGAIGFIGKLKRPVKIEKISIKRD